MPSDSAFAPTASIVTPLRRAEVDVDPARWHFWLWWLPTVVGFIAGGALATVVAGPVDALPAAAVGGVLAGAVIGVGQWLVLRHRLPRAGWWLPATAVAQGVVLAAGATLVGYQSGLTSALVVTALGGLLLVQLLRAPHLINGMP